MGVNNLDIWCYIEFLWNRFGLYLFIIDGDIAICSIRRGFFGGRRVGWLKKNVIKYQRGKSQKKGLEVIDSMIIVKFKNIGVD